MTETEYAFNDFKIVFNETYRGKINRHVVVERSNEIPQADFSTYEEAYNFAVFLQEPISAAKPPQRYERIKLNQVGQIMIIRTVKKRGKDLQWTYLITDKFGVNTITTEKSYKDAFLQAVKISRCV